MNPQPPVTTTFDERMGAADVMKWNLREVRAVELPDRKTERNAERGHVFARDRRKSWTPGGHVAKPSVAVASLEDNSGLKQLLSQASVYQAFQDLLGARRLHRRIVREHLRLSAGSRMLDIGCGPAAIVGELPAGVRYVGVDSSARYIEAARARWGSRGEFRCLRVDELVPAVLPEVDLVLALGLLHHLDDADAAKLFELALSSLRKGGRVVTYDPCLIPAQKRISRFLVSRDRGRHVRSPEAYAALARRVFPNVESSVLDGHLRIPYTAVILEVS
jgi:SAM-dependent methyltransferase